MIGQTISHYKILEKLGEGGMGIVYKAQDTKLDRTVALKFLPHHAVVTEADQARFLHEARSAAVLNHPNVCVIHSIDEADLPADGQSGGRQFIVMEYVDGQTLRKVIEEYRDTPMKINDAITFAIQIGEALQEAHSKGIVHRDVKAENIMVNAKNQIKVMDFGLAKLKGSLKLTRSSSTVGTLAYMAPEQLQGGQVDARSDIFSFGAVLFEMLTGNLPFRGEHEAALMYSIVNEEPESPDRFRPDVPALLINLIQRALEKTPADRYQSVGDLVIELRRVLRQSSKVVTKVHRIPTDTDISTGQPDIPARTGIHQTHTVAPTSRKTSLRIGGAVAAIVLLAIVAYLTMFKTDEPKTPAFSFQSMKITRLTSNGKARTAAISPDGKYVVYSLDDAGKQSLWVRQVVTNSNVQIIPPGDVNYLGLTLSGDGNYVYYVAQPFTASVNSLYQIPVLGGAPKKLTEKVRGNIGLSPDGKQMTFTRFYENTGEFSLMVANLDGSNERVLATHKADLWFDGEPAWSPDGKIIACGLGSWEGGFHFSVVVVGVADGKEEKISDRKWRDVRRLRWTPDGNGLLVSGTDVGSTTSQIWQIQPSTGIVTKLTNDLNSYAALSLTGDGKSICVVQEDITSNLHIVSLADINKATQVTSGKDIGTGGIAWGADGRLIYGSTESGNQEIWISNTDGTGKLQLTNDPDGDFEPAVSADGKFILFTSLRSGIPNIWRMEHDGSRQKQLTTGGEDYRASISPDGKWFVFDSWDSGPNTVMRQSFDGGAPVQISESNGSSQVISPEGKRVAYIFAQGGERNIVKVLIIPAEGGKALDSFDWPGFASRRSLRWTRDGKSLSYIETRDGVGNIWIQPLDGSAARQVTKFTSDFLSAYDWSPDGKMLVVCRTSFISDVLLMTAEQ